MSQNAFGGGCSLHHNKASPYEEGMQASTSSRHSSLSAVRSCAPGKERERGKICRQEMDDVGMEDEMEEEVGSVSAIPDIADSLGAGSSCKRRSGCESPSQGHLIQSREQVSLCPLV